MEIKKMINEGIYNDLSSDDYHNDKNSLSRSSIKDFAKNAFYYWSMHLNPNRPSRETTDAMIIGSALHTLVLEPQNFLKQYAIEPPKMLLKDVGREIYDIYKKHCDYL